MVEIELKEMTPTEFAMYAEFSFRNFVTEVAKSSGKPVDEALRSVKDVPGQPTVNDIWRVICFSQKPIGFIWIHLLSKQDEAFGYDIYLDEGHRSRGIGRTVMETCRKLLKEKGIRRVEICVFQNNLAARSLYASLGFKEKSYDESKKQFRLETEID